MTIFFSSHGRLTRCGFRMMFDRCAAESVCACTTVVHVVVVIVAVGGGGGGVI